MPCPLSAEDSPDGRRLVAIPVAPSCFERETVLNRLGEAGYWRPCARRRTLTRWDTSDEAQRIAVAEPQDVEKKLFVIGRPECFVLAAPSEGDGFWTDAADHCEATHDEQHRPTEPDGDRSPSRRGEVRSSPIAVAMHAETPAQG